ncbi:hypothetical protein BB561_004609 [Smittium simulii]|uniref:Uncharacterized protein n=1 Tax=Smittium simulii TaxID=133385 RepID=A0A2T9YFC0_9FUNG|nr:hypothetical protein BB561_004609 [Smittium simulii]
MLLQFMICITLGLSPLKIEPHDFEENSTQGFSRLFKKRGEVVEYKIFSNNIILSVNYITELINLPSVVFDREKARKKLSTSYFYYEPNYFYSTYILKQFSFFFKGNNLQKVIVAEAYTLQFYIKQYINQYGVLYKNDRIIIPDVLDFMIYILSKNAYLRIFGNKLSKRPDVARILNDVTAIEYQKNTLKLKIIELWNYLRYYKSAKGMNVLSEIISTEINKFDGSIPDSRNISLIELLAKDPEFLKDNSSFYITSGLVQTFKSMIIIPPSRLLSILIDISIDPNILSLLSSEQTDIIEEFGVKYDLNAFKKMPILHKVIMKSLLQSSPASYMDRELNQNLVLSNGITLKKNSVVSINMFSHYHSETKESKNLNIVLQNQEYKEKNNSTNFRLLWGYGE